MKHKKQTIICLFMILVLLITSNSQTIVEADSKTDTNTIEVVGELEMKPTNDSSELQETAPTKPKPNDPNESVTPSVPPKDSVLPQLGEQIQLLYVFIGVILVLLVLVTYQLIRERRRNPKKMSEIIMNHLSSK